MYDLVFNVCVQDSGFWILHAGSHPISDTHRQMRIPLTLTST